MSNMQITIIPAILTDSLADFRDKLKKVRHFGGWLQIDVMDGKFVPNKSLSLLTLRKVKIPLTAEVHLMVENPEKYFEDCEKLGAKRVIWHLEGTKNPGKVLGEMAKYSFQKGIALNPATPVEKLKPYLLRVNVVLLLGVTPGFQSQKFQPRILKKIGQLKKISKKIKIGVDGGVNVSNIRKIAKAGADYFVVGSYLVKAKNIKKNFQLLKIALKQ